MYLKESKKAVSAKKTRLIGLVLIIVILFLADLFLSLESALGWGWIFNLNKLALKIFLALILPHVLAVILVGFSLGITGAVLQIFLQNALADPGLLGVSAGGTVFGFCGNFLFKFLDHGVTILTNALFSLIGVFAVMFFLVRTSLGVRMNRLGVAGIILLGLGLNTCFSALMSLLIVFLNQENLSQLMLWSLGDFQVPSYALLLLALLLVGLGFFILLLDINNLDKLNFGFRAAFSMGVNLIKLKKSILFSLSLMMAGAVILAGPIGFVGLLAPHFARFFVGSRVKILLGVSGFSGVIWLLLADLISGSVMQGRIPVGVVCALLGGPLFILFLLEQGSLKSVRAD